MEVEGAGALVAGGASGLGEATVRGAARRGARVVIADLNAEKGEALAAELGERARFVEANVMEAEPVQAAVEPPPRPRAGCGSRSAAPGSAGRSGPPASRARTTSRSSTT